MHEAGQAIITRTMVLRAVEHKGRIGVPDVPSIEDVCRAAFLPFLRNVWPQERFLATIGVSRSFAALPALTGEAFVETAQTVLRFLKPFGAWSISEYGFFDDESGQPALARIDSPEKADAFLSVLDATIDFSANALIPEDLADALVQIRHVAPHLAKDPRFRRLWSACRRKK
jgi:hypothetical protein